MANLDAVDIKILELLQQNSNRTTKSIAQELGMTTSPIFERIKKPLRSFENRPWINFANCQQWAAQVHYIIG